MTPLRVLVISFLPPARGGIATWAGILGGEKPGRRCRFLFEDVSGPGGEADGRLRTKILAALRLLHRLARRDTHGPIDVLHLNSCISPLGLWRDLSIALIARARRIPLIVHFRGSLPDVARRLPFPSWLALRGLMATASANVGVTRESELFLRRQGRRAEYLPSLVEDEWFDRARDEQRPRESARVRVAYTGRLSRDKGTLDLLLAARALPEVEFVLMGEVTEEVHLEIDSASANVTVTGHLPRREVLDRLLGCDIFVFPSRREGSPNAVIEAMAAGLPVVATRVGGVTEMIDEGKGGHLVPASDSQALAEAVNRLAADPQLARRMGEYNRAVGRERFALSAVSGRLERIYVGLVVARSENASGRPTGRRNRRSSALPLPQGEAEP